jgi:hypothetical protein
VTREVTDTEIKTFNVPIRPYTPPPNGKDKRTLPIIRAKRKCYFYRREEFKKKGITDPHNYRQRWLADLLVEMCQADGSRNISYCFRVNGDIFCLDKAWIPFLIYNEFIDLIKDNDGHVISVYLRDKFFITYNYNIPTPNIEDVIREQVEGEDKASKLDFNELMRLAQEASQSANRYQSNN